jgi:hypothetical protein
MDYLKWNNLLAEYFFNNTKSGQEVLFYINDETINRLGQQYEVGLEDFIKSIKIGPNWTTRPGICQKAFQAYENWRLKDLEFPPYLGYLAFFVLAAGTETVFAPQSYYPGFWKLLNEPQDYGTPPSFHLMVDLWQDLEKWTREDKKEELGRFIVRVRGGFPHVGIPWSQTILSEEEQKHLINFFDYTKLDPTDPPLPERLTGLIIKSGHEFFKRRTLKIFEEKINNELKNALIEFILDKFEDWDGTVQYPLKDIDKVTSKVQPGLRICLRLDPMAGFIRSYFRFKTKRIFPEGGLFFSYSGDERTWFCSELQAGWSKIIKNVSCYPSEELDPFLFDWTKDFRLIDEKNDWRAIMTGASTRIFRLKIDGLPDWIETQNLERNNEFLIASYGEDIEKVRNWGKDFCEDFKEQNYNGLPSGWRLFYLKNTRESCPGIDTLFLSVTTRLTLKEGIRISHNRFYKFAPPKIVLENSMGSEKVTLNGRELNQFEPNIWILPDDVPSEVPLNIEVNTNNQNLKKIIWLEDFSMPSSFIVPYRGFDGEILSNIPSNDYTYGVDVKLSNKCESLPKLLPTFLSKRIIFIGERPGQITDWPQEPIAHEWLPVWAIALKHRTKWKVYFCGSENQAKENHRPGIPLENIKFLKKWHEVIWVNRKINAIPDLGQIKLIWKNYMDAAKRV